MRGAHVMADCRQGPNCTLCHQRNHMLLHTNSLVAMNKASQEQRPLESASMPNQMAAASINTQNSHPILQSCLAWLLSHSGETLQVRVFLDSRCEKSRIWHDVAHRLGLDGPTEDLCLVGIGGKALPPTKEKMVKFHLRSRYGKYTTQQINACTTEKITNPLRMVDVDPKNFWHLKDLPFVCRQIPMRWSAHRQPHLCQFLRYPTLQGCGPWKTTGTSCTPNKAGICSQRSERVTITATHCLPSSCPTIGASLRIPTTLETRVDWDSTRTKLKPHQMWVWGSNVPRQDDTLWSKKQDPTSLLFKENPPTLGLNKLKALCILRKVEASTIKIKRVVQVNAAFNEFIEKDFAEKVFKESEPEQVHYLPGPAVFKEDSTTNTRIVFNVSATSETGNTLNKCLFQGPCLLPDIVQVLIRFCLNPIAFTLDISKMFLWIKLNHGKDYLRFFWRNCDHSQKPQIFQMTSVTFRVISSPFLAIDLVLKHADLFAQIYPLAAATVRDHLYMDDMPAGSKKFEEAKTPLVNFLHFSWKRTCNHTNFQAMCQTSCNSSPLMQSAQTLQSKC